MPSPRPINCQFERSAAVPCASLGYHASGTVKLRSSTRPTMIASFVTATFCASAGRTSVAEELMPSSQEYSLVCGHQCLQPIDLHSAEAAAVEEPNRLKPELRAVSI